MDKWRYGDRVAAKLLYKGHKLGLFESHCQLTRQQNILTAYEWLQTAAYSTHDVTHAAVAELLGRSQCMGKALEFTKESPYENTATGLFAAMLHERGMLTGLETEGIMTDIKMLLELQTQRTIKDTHGLTHVTVNQLMLILRYMDVHTYVCPATLWKHITRVARNPGTCAPAFTKIYTNLKEALAFLSKVNDLVPDRKPATFYAGLFHVCQRNGDINGFKRVMGLHTKAGHPVTLKIRRQLLDTVCKAGLWDQAYTLFRRYTQHHPAAYTSLLTLCQRNVCTDPDLWTRRGEEIFANFRKTSTFAHSPWQHMFELYANTNQKLKATCLLRDYLASGQAAFSLSLVMACAKALQISYEEMMLILFKHRHTDIFYQRFSEVFGHWDHPM